MKNFVNNATLAWLLALSVALGFCGCKKSGDSAEKTAEQRAEDYHRYLTTADLSLFELKGNVRYVIYPEGFLHQYLSDAAEAPDSVAFTASGMCESALMLGSDTLQNIRNTEGSILCMTAAAMAVNFSYADDGTVASWTSGETTCRFTYADGQVAAVSTATSGRSAEAKVEVIASDEIGNWTQRKLHLPGQQSQLQSRSIVYY